MYRSMRMSAVFTMMMGSGTLFGMEAKNNDNKWGALPLEIRDGCFYKDMKMSELCRFSLISKDIYEDIYYYKRERFLGRVKKSEYGSLGSSHHLGNPRALTPIYTDGSLHNLARVKQNIKHYKQRFGIIKQSWMIEKEQPEKSLIIKNKETFMIKNGE